VVSVADQRLLLFEGDALVADFPVSTAARGIGGADGSLCTPPGTHRVHRRIGDGVAPGSVFESREPTGQVWDGGSDCDGDLILTRIITLEGCEPGVNQGAGVDSLARYIYIHGTNHESDLGGPASQGCVRMANRDVIELFDRVREGDAVVIV
jgi:UDP-N-acetylmuramate--alanine ligase